MNKAASKVILRVALAAGLVASAQRLHNKFDSYLDQKIASRFQSMEALLSDTRFS